MDNFIGVSTGIIGVILLINVTTCYTRTGWATLQFKTVPLICSLVLLFNSGKLLNLF